MPNAIGGKQLQDIETEIADELWNLSTANLVRPTKAVLDRIINDTEREICAAYDWSWLYAEQTFNTVVGQQTPYTMESNIQDILWMSVPLYQARISWMSMSEWESRWPGRYGAAGPCRPYAYIDAPPTTDGLNTQQWFLFPAADNIYTVNIGVRLRAGILAQPTDTPLIPEEWQGMLLNKAKAKCLGYVGGSSMERMQFYEGEFEEQWKLAWLADQSKAETVNQFRNAASERALSFGNPGNFINGVWQAGI